MHMRAFVEEWGLPACAVGVLGYTVYKIIDFKTDTTALGVRNVHDELENQARLTGLLLKLECRGNEDEVIKTLRYMRLRGEMLEQECQHMEAYLARPWYWIAFSTVPTFWMPEASAAASDQVNRESLGASVEKS